MSDGDTLRAMCGIAGLFAKTPEIEGRLGHQLAAMLGQLAERGPDSAGVALYGDPVPHGECKVSLLAPSGHAGWAALVADLEMTVGATRLLDGHGAHAVLHVAAPAPAVRERLAAVAPELLVLGTGQAIELHKRTGHPSVLVDACGLETRSGTHALGHTRMATESRVTTAGSHPFSTGEDLCLVHNGSLSNHNTLRRRLRRHGIAFGTDNDSEVAAGYLTWRLASGDTLEEALAAALRELDGFFTFAVGTRDGFAVLRDPIACKPAILAETPDWVAMASEHRAIATLPGAEDADVWEPEPGRIYAWSRAAVVA